MGSHKKKTHKKYLSKELEIIDRWIGKQIKTPRICLFLYDYFLFHFFIIFFPVHLYLFLSRSYIFCLSIARSCFLYFLLRSSFRQILILSFFFIHTLSYVDVHLLLVNRCHIGTDFWC